MRPFHEHREHWHALLTTERVGPRTVLKFLLRNNIVLVCNPQYPGLPSPLKYLNPCLDDIEHDITCPECKENLRSLFDDTLPTRLPPDYKHNGVTVAADRMKDLGFGRLLKGEEDA